MKYLETFSYDPCYNLAFEEYVLSNFRDDDCLILWQNDNTIVFGSNQNPIAEINMEQAEKYSVNIVRRSTGGGAVYHDLGNLNFSYITDWNDGENRNYEFFLTPIVKAFKRIGIHIDIKGRNDMLIDGQKISGSAQRLKDSRILHHGTLLINSDLDMIQNVLNVNKAKIQSKGIKSVRSRVTNIQEHTDEKLDIDKVKALIIESFSEMQPVEKMELTDCELTEIRQLADEKYRSWDWTYARSADCGFTVSERFDGGSVRLDLDIREGIITECVFSGDFLSLADIAELECKIKSCRYNRETLKKILDDEDTGLYFGAIAKDDILNMFFTS